MYGPGTSARCPKCGARGAETCTTKDGRDHLARAQADDALTDARQRQLAIQRRTEADSNA